MEQRICHDKVLFILYHGKYIAIILLNAVVNLILRISTNAPPISNNGCKSGKTAVVRARGQYIIIGTRAELICFTPMEIWR